VEACEGLIGSFYGSEVILGMVFMASFPGKAVATKDARDGTNAIRELKLVLQPSGTEAGGLHALVDDTFLVFMFELVGARVGSSRVFLQSSQEAFSFDAADPFTDGVTSGAVGTAS